MKIASTRDESVLVAPSTLEEAGIMQWLYARFEGKKVELGFDTTVYDGQTHHPMLWIYEAPAEQATEE